MLVLIYLSILDDNIKVYFEMYTHTQLDIHIYKYVCMFP